MKTLLTFLTLTIIALGKDRPNFVIIYTDDHGYGDVSTYHPSDCQTPNIDRLAAEGMTFTSMRANCTVCSPSRAALLTGKYADRVGVPGVIRTTKKNSWGYFDPEATTLADALAKAGYHTAHVGKWHLGLTKENHPNKRGFHHFHGFLGDMMDSYLTHRRQGKNYMRLNEKTIDPRGHATDLFAKWASDYLNDRAKKKDEPFFLYLAFNAPHFPIEPPAEWVEKVKNRLPDLNKKRTQNVAFVEHLDDRIGQVLATLKTSGLDQNTVVIFTSDNGGALRYEQSNFPWRDGKQSHFDGGLKVPFAARWPGHLKPNSKSDHIGLVFDIFPTLLKISGTEIPDDLDAHIIPPFFPGAKAESERSLYFVRKEGGRYQGNNYHALIRHPWKILQNLPGEPYELYHLENDPGEKNNLAKAKPEILENLTKLIEEQIAIGQKTPWQKPD